MEFLLHFLLTYQNYIFLAMFGVLTVVAAVNFIYNPYSRQNRQLKKFTKSILEKPSNLILQIKRLPKEYQRQWRAYVNSQSAKPSIVFEFVKLPKRYLLWFLQLLATVTSVVYVVAFLLSRAPTVFPTQVAFLLAGTLVVLVNKLIERINLVQARQLFGKFVHDLNVVTSLLNGNNRPKQPQGQSALQQEDCLQQPTTLPTLTLKNEDVIEKAVALLKQKGLDNPRTAEEQRKLNVALNNLLQACCKKG